MWTKLIARGPESKLDPFDMSRHPAIHFQWDWDTIRDMKTVWTVLVDDPDLIVATYASTSKESVTLIYIEDGLLARWKGEPT